MTENEMRAGGFKQLEAKGMINSLKQKDAQSEAEIERLVASLSAKEVELQKYQNGHASPPADLRPRNGDEHTEIKKIQDKLESRQAEISTLTVPHTGSIAPTSGLEARMAKAAEDAKIDPQHIHWHGADITKNLPNADEYGFRQEFRSVSVELPPATQQVPLNSAKKNLALADFLKAETTTAETPDVLKNEPVVKMRSDTMDTLDTIDIDLSFIHPHEGIERRGRSFSRSAEQRMSPTSVPTLDLEGVRFEDHQDDLSEKEVAAKKPIVDEKGDSWEAHTDDQGRIFYYCSEKDESKWVRPGDEHLYETGNSGGGSDRKGEAKRIVQKIKAAQKKAGKKTVIQNELVTEDPAFRKSDSLVQPPNAVYMKNGIWLDADGNRVFSP